MRMVIVSSAGQKLFKILASISRGIREILKEQKRMEQEFEDVRREVSEARTVMTAGVKLIKGIKVALDKAIANAAAAGSLDALKEFSSSLDTGTNELAQAIEENTIPEPAG